VERLRGEALLGAELGDGETAFRLAMDAIAPECVEFEIGSSRHGLGLGPIGNLAPISIRKAAPLELSETCPATWARTSMRLGTP
jgi:hypothetical protein